MYNTKVKKSRGPGQRAGLTRERVLAAAHELLSDSGVEALTMRTLAEHLGVSPNALYSHVSSKTDLIDTLLDDVLGEVQAPALDAGKCVPGLNALMVSSYDVLLSRPNLVPHYVARQGARGPNADRLGEVMLGFLAQAGVTGERALEARRVLIVFTIGYAAFTTSPLATNGGDPVVAADETRSSFESGLDWLIAGIRKTNRRTRR